MTISSQNKKALKVFRQEIRDKYPNATKEEQRQIYKLLKNDFVAQLNQNPNISILNSTEIIKPSQKSDTPKP